MAKLNLGSIYYKIGAAKKLEEELKSFNYNIKYLNYFSIL